MSKTITRPTQQDKYDRLAALFRRLVAAGVPDATAGRQVDAAMIAYMRPRGAKIAEADL